MTHIYKNIFLPETMKSPEIRQLFSVLSTDDGKARLVGGCVRDALLGHVPNDIDIATTHTPERVIELLSSCDISSVPTGIKHGTVTAIINKQPFEITTLRKDIECHGRHATIEFTHDFEKDAARRDFTFNAMSCDLDGRLYDYFNGEDDLKKGIVRFVGAPLQRIEEDFLRILRFFRFFVRYGNKPIDIPALQAITHHAPSLEILSGERIQNEMFRLLISLSDTSILEIMHDSHVLEHITLPCMSFNSTNQLIMLEKEEFKHTNSPLPRLACLLRTNVAKETCTAALIKHWRLSNHDKILLKKLVKLPDSLKQDIPIAVQKQLLRQWGKEYFTYVVSIAWAEWLAYEKEPKRSLNTSFSAMLELAETWDILNFPVSGKDMIALGIKPGKQLGELLTQAENWWESEHYQPNSTEIIAYIKEIREP